MAHEANLAKGATEGGKESTANCPLCGTAATQAHIKSVCTHPAMIDQRQLLKRDIELHFLCLRHTALPPAQGEIDLATDASRGGASMGRIGIGWGHLE
jgi:hypothetical protein